MASTQDVLADPRLCMLQEFNGCAAAATHEDCTLARIMSSLICHHTPLRGAIQPYILRQIPEQHAAGGATGSLTILMACIGGAGGPDRFAVDADLPGQPRPLAGRARAQHALRAVHIPWQARPGLRAGMRALQSGTVTYQSDSCRLNPELCPIMTQARWGCRSGSSRRYGMCPAEGQTHKQWARIWGQARS